MPLFTEHLRDEISVIRFGLDRLDSQLANVRNGGKPDVESMRALVFALRLLFKRNFLEKLEELLYPALTTALDDSKESYFFDEASEVSSNGQARFRLMRLQLVLDGHHGRVSAEDNLAQCIEDCLETIRRVIAITTNLILPLADRHLRNEDQERLYSEARAIDATQAVERSQAAHIFQECPLVGAVGS